MADEPTAAGLDDVALWPGIFREPRRFLRKVVDERRWAVPALLVLGVWVTDQLLRASTGAPMRPPLTGSFWSDVALGWVVVLAIITLLPFAFGRLFGGRGTLAEVFVVMLWCTLPAALTSVAVDLVGLARHGAGWWTLPREIAKPAELLALPPLTIFVTLLEAVVGIWSGGLAIVGLSEVHGVTSRRVVLAVFLPLFVLGAVAAIAATIFVAQASAPGR